MGWLELLKVVLGLAESLTRFYSDRQILEAGKAQAILNQLTLSRKEIADALQARKNAQSGSIDSDSDGVLDDDGFGE